MRAFLKEKPGKGKGRRASKYRYNVESLSDGRVMNITRPAPSKWGFDFLIHVEGRKFSNNRDNPSHRDILRDLSRKKRKKPLKFRKLLRLITRVYEGEDPEDLARESQRLKSGSGVSVEELLKTIKWLFIEQDVHYWNYSGRKMLMSGIEDV